jgi:hypothetical protein
MNPALETAITRFDRRFGCPTQRDIDLARKAPSSDESARAARSTLVLVKMAVEGRL